MKRTDPFDTVVKWSRWLAGALFIVVFLYFIALEIGWLPKEAEITKENPYTGKSQVEVYDLTSFIIIKTMDGLNYIAPALGAIASLIVAIFTGTLWYSTRLLWRETERLAEGAEDQHETLRDSVTQAKKAARAAQISAEAARDALDRPWLWISRVDSHYEEKGGQASQLARVHLKNYGKAPAIINGASAVLFYGPARGLNDAFRQAFGEIPKTMLPFPEREELASFINQHGRSAFVRRQLPEGYSIRDLIPTPIDDGTVVDETHTFELEFRGHRVIEMPGEGKGLPVEYAGSLFLIGRIIYSMPTESVEIINFCHVASALGGFSRFGNRPYNDRRRVETKPPQG